MNDKKAVVLGGAGDVGEGIVRQLRDADWHTIVPSRSAARLDRLETATSGPGEFTPLVASIGDVAGAKKAASEIIDQFGEIDLVVASIGGWWAGSGMLHLRAEDWHEVLNNNLTSHVSAAQAFLPPLLSKTSSQYVFINGGAARMPVPMSGPVSIVASAQEMMQKVLASEHAKDDVTIYSLVLLSLIQTRSREVVPPGSLSADDVGRAIVTLYDHPPAAGASVEISTPEGVDALAGGVRSPSA